MQVYLNLIQRNFINIFSCLQSEGEIQIDREREREGGREKDTVEENTNRWGKNKVI